MNGELAHGMVHVFGAHYNEQLKVYFVNPGTPTPQASVSNNIGIIYRPFDQMSAWLDVLRNEQPLYVYAHASAPDLSGVHSAQEDVGEEDN